MGAVDEGKIASDDGSSSAVNSTHWADIFYSGAVIIAHLPNNLIPAKRRFIGTTAAKNSEVRQRLAIRPVGRRFELVV